MTILDSPISHAWLGNPGHIIAGGFILVHGDDVCGIDLCDVLDGIVERLPPKV